MRFLENKNSFSWGPEIFVSKNISSEEKSNEIFHRFQYNDIFTIHCKRYCRIHRIWEDESYWRHHYAALIHVYTLWVCLYVRFHECCYKSWKRTLVLYKIYKNLYVSANTSRTSSFLGWRRPTYEFFEHKTRQDKFTVNFHKLSWEYL